jgi:signal transduction histidine kinase
VDTTVVEWLAMHQMQVTWADLQQAVRTADGQRRHVGLARSPGHHDVLVVPLAGDTTVTVLAGPRSRLLSPTRFGRLTQPDGTAEAPYTIQVVSGEQARPDATFRRSERFVRADQRIAAGGDPLVVRATVAIQPPSPFVVRAALTVLLDVILVLLLWRVVERILGAGPRGDATVFRRSHRRTLIAALTSFFVVPAGFFTLWSALRLRQDVARERGDEVTRALSAIGDDPAMAPDSLLGLRPITLAQVADRADAEVGIYRGGRLTAASTPILAELGLLSPVLDPGLARTNLAEAGRLATPVPGANVRIGGRIAGPGNTAIVAALPGANAELEREQLDLGLLLLLASLGGMLGALGVAGAVARALNQPIEALRLRALAIGRREAAPTLRAPPAEFVPVFTALAEMERDLVESEARLEDEAARTARIVAWGEMARQVAHEIKNPLTPMRLGLQHLKRLGADGRADLAAQAEATADRLLGEIDRLDRIARSFARYGTPPERDAGPLEAIDLAGVMGEIAQLYAVASSPLAVTVRGEAPPVLARREEMIQVVLNLVDNARAAGAEAVWLDIAPASLRVRDDGRGIPGDQLERIFEPTFSTTSSGTGLGLAIARRLVEGWGARITATSRPGEGAEFRIRWDEGSTAPHGTA